MTPWRPHPGIRVKALGLHWRGPRLLVAAVPDDSGRIKGMRPLGGSVEFGESTRDTVIREFREELGIPVEPLGAPIFLETLYTHEGSPGHEILAIYDVGFPPGAFDGVERILFHEDSGTRCEATWVDPATLDLPGRPRLFPDGLKEALARR